MINRQMTQYHIIVKDLTTAKMQYDLYKTLEGVKLRGNVPDFYPFCPSKDDRSIHEVVFSVEFMDDTGKPMSLAGTYATITVQRVPLKDLAEENILEKPQNNFLFFLVLLMFVITIHRLWIQAHKIPTVCRVRRKIVDKVIAALCA